MKAVGQTIALRGLLGWGLRPAKFHEKPTGDADWGRWWGEPPGPRGTPSSRCRANDISTMQSASRPTGASAADQGVRPTIPRGWFFDPVSLSAWDRQFVSKNWDLRILSPVSPRFPRDHYPAESTTSR
jgi:hypothetical protein